MAHKFVGSRYVFKVRGGEPSAQWPKPSPVSTQRDFRGRRHAPQPAPRYNLRAMPPTRRSDGRSAEEIRSAIEGFLKKCKQPALLEPGEELFALTAENLTLDVRGSRFRIGTEPQSARVANVSPRSGPPLRRRFPEWHISEVSAEQNRGAGGCPICCRLERPLSPACRQRAQGRTKLLHVCGLRAMKQ
jgi:hypothetical protein